MVQHSFRATVVCFFLNRPPTLRSTPFASLSGRCAMKPLSAGHLHVGPRNLLESLAAVASSIAAVSPAPTLAVSPSLVPSVTSALASASPSVRRFRYAAGVMLSTSPLCLRLLHQASVMHRGPAWPLASLVRLLPRGRVGARVFVARFLTSTRRGRRIASADSYPAASPAYFGSFVYGSRGASVTEALSPVLPLRGPTRRSRGRCAIKPRSAPELQRWAS